MFYDSDVTDVSRELKFKQSQESIETTLNITPNMHIVIRRFERSDKEDVEKIYRDAIEEHINPAFMHAMSRPLYITISLFLCISVYMIAQSVILPLVSGGAWLGLIYFCCYEFYSGYVRERLRTDMKDIPGHYLSHPDRCFWVAEAQLDGRPQILGMVAVEGRSDGDGKKFGELLRMIVSSGCRRAGLGKRLVETVEDFCRERGFWKIVLSTSSTQRAAEALYYKTGFRLTLVDTQSESPQWMVRMTQAKILYMEKVL